MTETKMVVEKAERMDLMLAAERDEKRDHKSVEKKAALMVSKTAASMVETKAAKKVETKVVEKVELMAVGWEL